MLRSWAGGKGVGEGVGGGEVRKRVDPGKVRESRAGGRWGGSRREEERWFSLWGERGERGGFLCVTPFQILFHSHSHLISWNIPQLIDLSSDFFFFFFFSFVFFWANIIDLTTSWLASGSRRNGKLADSKFESEVPQVVASTLSLYVAKVFPSIVSIKYSTSMILPYGLWTLKSKHESLVRRDMVPNPCLLLIRLFPISS